MKTKRIYGNNQYHIDLHNNIYDQNLKIVSNENLKIKNGIVYGIKINNNIVNLPLEFLKLISWFELDDVYTKIDVLENVYFVKINNKRLGLITNNHMYFRDPVYYRTNYRIIPNYPRYAINKKQEVLDTKTNRVVQTDIDPNGYVVVYIRTPDSTSNRTVRLHRLMAFTYVYNPDPKNKTIINHIDGNKLNNNINNLEWCTIKENNQHARDIGLTNDNKPIKVRDYYTGEIKHYQSMAEFAEFVGLKNGKRRGYGVYIDNTNIGSLYLKRYEIKYEKDHSNWFYEQEVNKYFIPGKTYYIITIKNMITGKVYKTNRLKILRKILPGFTYYETDINVVINKANSMFDNYDISYKKITVHGPYVVRNVQENTVKVVDSIEDISTATGVGKNIIRNILKWDKRVIVDNRWAFYKQGKIFNKSLYKPYYPKKIYVAIDKINKIRKTLSSLSSIAKFCKLSKKHLLTKFKDSNGTITIKNWVIKDITGKQ